MSRIRLLGSIGQGIHELVAYSVDAVNHGVPANPVVVARAQLAVDTYQNVTEEVFPNNAPVVSGTRIDLSLFGYVDLGVLYRIEVSYLVNGNTFEDVLEVTGEL